MTVDRPVEEGPQPTPGPHNPLLGTPRPAPMSVRRTWTIDVRSPSGADAEIVAEVRARDIRVAADSRVETIDELDVALEIEPESYSIGAVNVGRAGMRLQELVGAGVRGGFGRQLAARFPHESRRRSLSYSALEDLGGATLVSGYARLRDGYVAFTGEHAESAAKAQADICIGWAADGPTIETIRVHGRNPVPVGPIVPVSDPDEAPAWHKMPPLSRSTVRRRRRLDVSCALREPKSFRIQEHFRDSYSGAAGEMALHEYLVHAAVENGRIASIEVDPRVLPWAACPGAASSAQDIVGTALEDVPMRVRRDLRGTTSCTHLNSTLRCLADARSLIEHLCA